MLAAALVVFSCALTAAAAARDVTTSAAYALGPTSRCLAKRGADVGRVRPLDRRLRSFRDLAQKNSIQVDLRTGRVALAFATDEAGAKLLVELLTVARDPLRYVLIRRANVVLMFRATHRPAFTAVSSCLRA